MHIYAHLCILTGKLYVSARLQCRGWDDHQYHSTIMSVSSGIFRSRMWEEDGRSRFGLLSKACRRHHVQQQKLQNNRSESEPAHNGSTFVGSTEQPVAVGPTEQPMVNFLKMT